MYTLTHWLCSGPPWAAYRAQVDLLNLPAADPQVAAARLAMLADPKVQALVAGLANLAGRAAQQPQIRRAPAAPTGLSGRPGPDARRPRRGAVLRARPQPAQCTGAFPGADEHPGAFWRQRQR